MTELLTKIGFVFTNFNNSQVTREAIHSISLNHNWKETFIVIVDNNSDDENVELLKEMVKVLPNVHVIYNVKNVGYFNGLNDGIKYLRNFKKNINHIVIGNNDLVFPSNFIELINRNLNLFKKYPVISPNLITLDGVHQNPHVISKISKFREVIFDLYYLNYYMSIVISKLAKVTKRISERRDREQHEIAQTIYQGYGACYILGSLFFKYFDYLWAPTFLMDEELFLSKQLESKNLSIFYEPSIIVKHQCHVTMKKIPRKKLWEISRESHRVYRKYVKIWN